MSNRINRSQIICLKLLIWQLLKILVVYHYCFAWFLFFYYFEFTYDLLVLIFVDVERYTVLREKVLDPIFNRFSDELIVDIQLNLDRFPFE